MRTRETETEFQPVTAWQCAALKNSGAYTFGDCERSRFRDVPRRAANRENKRAAEKRRRVLYGFED